jgi:hypothetical protein
MSKKKKWSVKVKSLFYQFEDFVGVIPVNHVPKVKKRFTLWFNLFKEGV